MISPTYTSRRSVLSGVLATTLVPGFATSQTLNVAGKNGIPDAMLFQEAINHHAGSTEIVLPAGIFICDQLSLPSNVRITGMGQGRTVLKLTAYANRPAIVNADKSRGNTSIDIRNLTIDGNGVNQLSLSNGVVLENVTNSYFDIEVRNCRGTGFLLSGGTKNKFGPNMHVHKNGVQVAGYGLYIYGSDDNVVTGGRYDNNCIGIVVEASGPGLHARRNRIIAPTCLNNRADFGQSGAGVHFEQSVGADCNDCELISPVCAHSTGVGINNSCCNLSIRGGQCTDNAEAGIVTIAASGIRYVGVTCTGNAKGVSTGYRGEMRFDDGGLKPGTTGTVANCRLRGSAPDGGMRTMSAHSAIKFIDNDVRGYRNNYILSSPNDSVI